jgi:hypothetical protein
MRNVCPKHGCERVFLSGNMRCPECRRASRARYKASDKGKDNRKASRARYEASDKGKDKRKARHARYAASDKGKTSRARCCARRDALPDRIWKHRANTDAVRKLDKAGRTSFHHDSYLREDWLKVRELCGRCHRAWHKAHVAVMPPHFHHETSESDATSPTPSQLSENCSSAPNDTVSPDT